MKGKKGPFVCLEYPGGKGGGMAAERYRQQVLESHAEFLYRDVRGERSYHLPAGRCRQPHCRYDKEMA